MLLGREYRPGVINSAIERAKAIPRTKALEKAEELQRPETVAKQQNDGT